MKQVICTVALLLSAPTVWAQTAFIRGLVSDITEEPISGVTVTAESAETQPPRTSHSRSMFA